MIDSVFETIIGEGKYVGYPAVFVRFHGCNKHCAYCDTKTKESTLTLDDVCNFINSKSTKYIVLTGGEPCQYPSYIIYILSHIVTKSLKVCEIETNGTLTEQTKQIINFIRDNKNPQLSVELAIDIKIDSTAGYNNFTEIETMNRYWNCINHHFKVIINHSTPTNEMAMVDLVALSYPVFLQPEYGSKIPLEKLLFLAQFCDDARIIPQCHKILDIP